MRSVVHSANPWSRDHDHQLFKNTQPSESVTMNFKQPGIKRGFCPKPQIKPWASRQPLHEQFNNFQPRRKRIKESQEDHQQPFLQLVNNNQPRVQPFIRNKEEPWSHRLPLQEANRNQPLNILHPTNIRQPSGFVNELFGQENDHRMLYPLEFRRNNWPSSPNFEELVDHGWDRCENLPNRPAQGKMLRPINDSFIECSCSCGISEPPVIRCSDCKEHLCKLCTLKHQCRTTFGEHCLTSVPTKSSQEMMMKRDDICGPHDTYKSSLYCEQCSTAVCDVCYPVEHFTHSVISMRDAVERAEITASLLRSEALHGMQDMTAQIEKTKQALLLLNMQQRCMEWEISSSMGNLRKEVVEREKVLLSQFTAAKPEGGITPFKNILNRRVLEAPAREPIQRPCNSLRNAAEQCQLDEVAHFLPDAAVLEVIRTAGRVLTSTAGPSNGAIGGELKRWLSPSPLKNNKRPALDDSRDSHLTQTESEGCHNSSAPPDVELPAWNLWNDMDLTPLFLEAATGDLIAAQEESPSLTAHDDDSPSVPQEPQASRAYDMDVCVPRLIIGRGGSNDGELCRPWGICCDRDGNFIVADRSNNRISVFSPEGAFKFSFGRYGTVEPGSFNRPSGVATDSAGHIIVADKDNHRIQVFTSCGELIFMFGREGGRNGQFRYPWDLAVNSRDEIAVTDSRNTRVQLFSKNGQFLRQFSLRKLGLPSKQLDIPRGICFDMDDNILVTDFNNHRLLLIDDGFCYSKDFGSAGSMQMQFLRPQGVAVDPEGNVIVADSRNDRVQIFRSDGTYICQFGYSGDEPGQLNRPAGVCVTPTGRIAVVDFGNNRVQVF